MDIENTYSAFIRRVDKQCASFYLKFKAALNCKPHCTDCCKSFSLLPVEMDAVRKAVLDLSPADREVIKGRTLQESTECPLLVDGLCVIYSLRPLICRTQGLPLAYIDHEKEAIELSVCQCNFQEQQLFEKESLVYMDPINAELASLNALFSNENSLPAGIRYEIRDTLRVFLKL